MNLNLAHLQVPLPEDIAKMKGHGDFKLAIKVIEQRLTKALPTALKERLLLEKEILKRIPVRFPYNEAEALALLDEKFKDVTAQDLADLRESDAADWYYIEGELKFRDNFIDNIIKTRPNWAARLKSPDDLVDREGNFTMLDTVIGEMQCEQKVAYQIEVELSLMINESAYQPDKLLRVHLPLPVEYAQVKNLHILNIDPAPKFIAPFDQTQRTVYFEGKYSKEQVFKVAFSFENHVNYIVPKPEQVGNLQPTFYTAEQPPHIVFTPYIKALAAEIVGAETNPLLKARKIYDFVTTKVIYSFMRPYFTIPKIVEYCASSLKGDCGVLALLFITLCRCVGVPARWQSGLYANPLSINNHDWAQYYVAPYGWLFADCSFGGSAYRAGNAMRHNFYAANLEPYRIPFASEFQHAFNPAKQYLRNDPYDNQNGEAEYEDRGLIAGDYTTKSTLISINKL